MVLLIDLCPSFATSMWGIVDYYLNTFSIVDTRLFQSKNRFWNVSKNEKNWLYAVQTCLICCYKAFNLIWYLAKSVWHSRDSDGQRARARERKKLFGRKYSCQRFQCVDANWRRCICMFFKHIENKIKHILSFPLDPVGTQNTHRTNR